MGVVDNDLAAGHGADEQGPGKGEGGHGKQEHVADMEMVMVYGLGGLAVLVVLVVIEEIIVDGIRWSLRKLGWRSKRNQDQDE